MGKVEVLAVLLFINTPSPIPEADLIENSLKRALNDSNFFNLTIDPSSIEVVVPTTTAEPTTTTTGLTAAPSEVVLLKATLEEAFVPELNDPSSAEYRDLEEQVVEMCNFIFNQIFGSAFVGTSVQEFGSNMGKVEVEVELEFNDTASPIPEADLVVNSLKRALNDSNNTFNLTIDPSSIEVVVPTTTAEPTTIANSTTTGGSTSTPETTRTDGSTTTGESASTTASIHSDGSPTTDGSTSTSGSTHIGGSSTTGGSTSATGSTHTDGSTTTGTDGSTTAGESTSTVVTTHTDGSTTAGASTSTSGSTVTGGSATTGGSTTGSTGPSVTTNSVTVTTAAPPVVVLAANLEEPFVEELNDPNTVQYRTLERQVVTAYDIVYRARFGLLFLRTILLRFSRVVARTRAVTTRAVVELQFNQTAEIPQEEEIVDTLVQAVNNSSNNFNLTVDPNTVEVITTPNTTTSSPTTAQNPTATATAATTAIATTAAATTAAATTTNIATTASPFTTATTAAMTASVTAVAASTTAEQIITRRLTFRSAGETFTNDLLNTSSSAFINRAAMIKSELEPRYEKAFSSFRSLIVIAFSKGSVISTMDLGFASTDVPNGTQIADVLAGAASNITAFNIDTTSISVDGTQVSSGVNHKISLITASFFVLLSWLLSSQQ